MLVCVFCGQKFESLSSKFEFIFDEFTHTYIRWNTNEFFNKKNLIGIRQFHIQHEVITFYNFKNKN